MGIVFQIKTGETYPDTGLGKLPYYPTVQGGLTGAVDARLTPAMATLNQVGQVASGALIGAPTLGFDGIAANGGNYLDTGIPGALANIGTGAGQGTASTAAHTWACVFQTRGDTALGYPWGLFGSGNSAQGAEYIRQQGANIVAFATVYSGDGTASTSVEATLAKPAQTGLLEMYFYIATDNGKLQLYHPRTGALAESAVQAGKVFGFKAPQNLRCAAVPNSATFEKGLLASVWNGRGLSLAECRAEYDATRAFLAAFTGYPALA